MSDDTFIDARLSALLAEPDPAPDRAFVARVERAVAAERLFRAARVRAWRRFGTEALATGGVALGLAALWRIGSLAVPADTLTLSPAAVLPIALLLWLIVGMRPVGSR